MTDAVIENHPGHGDHRRVFAPARRNVLVSRGRFRQEDLGV
jgi:hypothetical protein